MIQRKKLSTLGSLQNREITIRAIALGILLSVVLGAANTYLGLYAGLTVSASIPAAVISMFLLRKVLRSGSILENNIVQSMASAGESLAAGIIFTIPALVISENWHRFEFWPTTIVALCGGLLGILFLIPFRRSFISEDAVEKERQSQQSWKKDLIYPEGRACAEVLRTGDTAGKAQSIFAGMTLGILYKLLASLLFKASAYFVIPLVPSGRRAAFMGLDFSAALAGVGFIVGLRIAFLIFLGGLLTWAVILPVFAPLNPETSLAMQVQDFWASRGRFAGVGAMIIGTVESLLLASSALRSGPALLKGLGFSMQPGHAKDQDSVDLPLPLVLLLLALVAVLGGFLLLDLAGWWAVPLMVWVLLLSIPVVSVATYLVGLVGSSNSPVSGITLSVLLLTGVILLPFVSGAEGVLALLLVAGMICCAAATAGDIAQDLKTGALIGASPARQQMAEILGVVVAAPFFALILQLLHETYGIGNDGQLKAPQATLFASLATAMFSHETLPLPMIGLGAFLGLLLFLWNRYGSFRVPIMPVAVGMYLPLSVSTPLFVGGLLRIWYTRSGRKRSRERESRMEETRNHETDRAAGEKDTTEEYGSHRKLLRWPTDPLLYGSGLIAGEALSGILLAVWILYTGSASALEWPAVFGFILFLMVLAPLSPLTWNRNKK